jgi:aspartate/methionine/tyrosine aminotransferase
LREAVAAKLTRDGLTTISHRILVTTGATLGLTPR